MCEDCGAHAGEEAGNGHGADHTHEDGHEHPHEEGPGHNHGHDHAHVDQNASAALHEPETTVRIAVTGKGGVGKTTLSAAIARHLAAHGETVAIDADPDMNLATALGVPAPPPITAERELIEERAGGGGLVSLTPDVADVLDSHSQSFGDAGRLLTIGAPTGGKTGCMCPENSVVRSLVGSAFGDDYVVMDMEAGIEHLGRGTAESVDAMLVVVEPSLASIETAERIESLAADLDVDSVFAVINQVRSDADVIEERLSLPVVTTIPYDESIAAAGLSGESPVMASESLRIAAAEAIGAVITGSSQRKSR